MKLVDILARQLKVWPADAVTAVQDLDGEVKFDHSHEMPRINKSKDVWIRQGDQGDSLYHQELAEDCSEAIVTREQWQAAVHALKCEGAKDGSHINWDTYPDATHFVISAEAGISTGFYRQDGIKMRDCENEGEYTFRLDDLHPLRKIALLARPLAEWSGEGFPPVGTVCEWKEKTGFQWVKATVLFITDSSVVMQREDGFEWQMMTARTVFRPFRTPGQIAAEARDKAVNEMLSALRQPTAISARYVCEELYDAGYRKFEIVEGER